MKAIQRQLISLAKLDHKPSLTLLDNNSNIQNMEIRHPPP